MFLQIQARENENNNNNENSANLKKKLQVMPRSERNVILSVRKKENREQGEDVKKMKCRKKQDLTQKKRVKSLHQKQKGQ